MRVAFLTPEYPTEYLDRGGLATYVQRMAKLLSESGHEPEVFVLSKNQSETFTDNGVQIHHINWRRNHPVLRYLAAGSAKLLRVQAWQSAMEWICQARALSVALERRHALAPFHLVQSANYLATGLLVRRRAGRVHAVRCSAATGLFSEFNQTSSLRETVGGYLERWAMRRADVVYAPSRYVADHYRRVHNLNVNILRPPIYLESEILPNPSVSLPERFFLHFGYLVEYKGTGLLAQALPLAWKEAPNLTMVWSGKCWDEQKMAQWKSLWGDRVNQVHITGPLTRPNLYAVLQRADAAILPSQVDNLPNTVIESLMFGIPVLGSRGASIDELVEEGRTGHLVALGDISGLAKMLAAMWLEHTPVRKGFKWDSDITNEMRPEKAVANLIALAELSEHDPAD